MTNVNDIISSTQFASVIALVVTAIIVVALSQKPKIDAQQQPLPSEQPEEDTNPSDNAVIVYESSQELQ